MALKHIVFDCDGVLWSGTNEGYFRCYHAAALEAGIPLDFEVARQRILENWGLSMLQEVKHMLPDHPALVPQVVQNYRRLVHSDMFLSCASLIPGTVSALQSLAARYRLSAITGMNPKNLDTLLARFHLRSFFRHVISTGDVSEPHKQKKTGYHLGSLLRQEGLKPNEALVVGDALVDVEMARQQQVPLVVVLTGHLDRQQAQELGVEHVLSSIADLPKWLECPGTA
jgi:phosphoglycolate phosphatase